ncbi:MAG: trehalose-phosphatase [Rubrivivax sp.]|nr:trehalose-phosphatase [Rubrivivax sp.]
MPAVPIHSRAGHAALEALMCQRALLAFDFDGTLAPIVAHADDARVPDALARRLAVLAAAQPLAIITGRSVADVVGRLGFRPWTVVGNHGAEQAGVPLRPAPALDAVRSLLAGAAPMLTAAGVGLEDKGLSLALHYREAADPEAARRAIDALLQPHQDAGSAVRIFGGKMVVNVAPADAPDKAHAMRRLVERCGVGAVFFAGDDANDEPVFSGAPPQWVTLRVGPDGHGTAARFALPGPEDMAALLDEMIRLGDL